MKRIITLSLMLVTMLTAFAQTITPTDNQKWWGYVTADAARSAIGIQDIDTYHCAIFIPGNNDVAAGKAINAVRLSILSYNAQNIKVWLASSLPTAIDADNTLQIVDAPKALLGKKQYDIALTTPYTIPAEGVYVGYSFTMTKATSTTDKFPIVTCLGDAANALFIKTDTKMPTWTDMNGQDLGSLFLQVLLEGEFPQNSVTPQPIQTVITKTGEPRTATITVKNNGGNLINSISYTVTADGVTSQEQTSTFAQPIDFNLTGSTGIEIPAENTEGIKQRTLTITKVNGEENTAINKGVDFTVYVQADDPYSFNRNVVVEEFTGTGCPWCPRGLVGMQLMRATFGDRFVGIGIHQYNSGDAMYLNPSDYARIGLSSAPSCKLNRGSVLDPYQGSKGSILDDFAAEMNQTVFAKVQVNGLIDADMNNVKATAKMLSLDGGNYKLEFAVIADGLTGTGGAWNQANNYAGYTAQQAGPDMAIFAEGGKFGQSYVENWIFDDVAIASSYSNGQNRIATQTLEAGVEKEVSLVIPMPIKQTLRDALLIDQIYVAAMLIDANTGRIVNSSKQKVVIGDFDPTGIRTAQFGATATEVARYTADGRQIAAPQRGLNIVRMSDGTTRKVIVK